MSWLAIGAGAAIGAWLRWGLGLWLNGLHYQLPYGTLVANLAGGYLIGFAVAFFSGTPGIPTEWRLFAITGFLGGLTTFSTFSLESMVLLQRGDIGWALGHSLLHLVGSILLCFAGYGSYRALAA